MEEFSLWTALASIIVALGGWRFTSYLFNRDTEKRKAEAKAKDAELETMRHQMDWMEEKYEAVSKKLDELYVKFRKLEEEKIQLLKEKNELLIALKIAEYNKCERPDDDCIRRLPPRQKCRLKMLLNGTYDEAEEDLKKEVKEEIKKEEKKNDIFEIRVLSHPERHGKQ